LHLGIHQTGSGEKSGIEWQRCKVIYNGVENIVRKPALKPNREIKGHFFFTIGTVRRKRTSSIAQQMKLIAGQASLYTGDSSLENMQNDKTTN
jgi:hypothetical protein